MQFSSSRKPGPAATARSLERSTAVELKFTQTGKYLIAAGSERQEQGAAHRAVLYIGVVGEKGWATQYPVSGSYKSEDEAAAAALHYGIQIITRQVRDVPLPGEPLPLAVPG